MNTLFQLAKRIPWWGYIGGIVLILILWQSLSGWAMSRKLCNMALDNLREDKTAIVERQKGDLEEKEKVITDLQKKIEANQKQRVAAQAESERLRSLVHEKDAQIIGLQKEREIIVVPVDPNVLADEFRKLGFKSRVVLPTR